MVCYVKTKFKKYYEKAKLCYMDTDSPIVYIKADDICKDIAEDVETNFQLHDLPISKPMKLDFIL